MHQNIEQDERTWQRLKLLIISRVIVLSIFLLVTFFLGTMRAGDPHFADAPAFNLCCYYYDVFLVVNLYTAFKKRKVFSV